MGPNLRLEAGQNGGPVFGPLPRLHRLLLISAALAVGVASGAWAAFFTPLPVAVSAGASMGAVAGLLISFALVHDFSHHRTAHRPTRIARRH